MQYHEGEPYTSFVDLYSYLRKHHKAGDKELRKNKLQKSLKGYGGIVEIEYKKYITIEALLKYIFSYTEQACSQLFPGGSFLGFTLSKIKQKL